MKYDDTKKLQEYLEKYEDYLKDRANNENHSKEHRLKCVDELRLVVEVLINSKNIEEYDYE